MALFVADLAAAERFWVDVMGYAVEWRPDPTRLPGPAAATTWRCTGAGRGRAAASITSGWRCRRRGYVYDWAAHLASHGVTPEKQPKTHRDGSRSLYFRAPEGLLVQIIHHSPMVG